MRNPTIRCTEGDRIRITFTNGSTRNRASARLMADGLKYSRSAARATLPSVSTASMVPLRFGIPGYISPLVVITAGYALFQAANNTAVMTTSRPEQRGAISGLLNLSRNLGLITGASVIAAVFVLGSATNTIRTARPEAVAAGMRLTFTIAAVLIVVALAIALVSLARSRDIVDSNRESCHCCQQLPTKAHQAQPSITTADHVPGTLGRQS